MKTYNIPWMSEEETERFLAEIKEMSLKPRATAAESVQDDDVQSLSSEESQASNLRIGGL